MCCTKVLVDLQLDCRNILQLLHHGVAGAEVVDGELKVTHAQTGENVERQRKLHQAGLGNLKNDALGGKVVLAREVHQDIGELQVAQ